MPRAGGLARLLRPLTLLRHVPMRLAAVALVLGFCGVSTVMLLALRRNAWDGAMQSSQNLLAAVAQDVQRNVELYDLSLQGAIASLARPDLQQATPEMRQVMLFDRAATAHYMGAMLVIDERGDIAYDSGSLPPRKRNYRDRDYFTAQRDRPDVGLYVSVPIHSRLDGDDEVVLSRRLNHPDGSFAGVVMGTLKLAYFYDLFARFNLGPRGLVALFRLDGTLLARAPEKTDIIGRNFAGSPAVTHLQAAPSGAFVARTLVDHRLRAYSFTRIGTLPLAVSVALSMGDIYAAWRTQAAVIGSVLAGLCGLAVTLLVLLGQELRRRVAAEDALVAAAERLSVMAATDELTGLANRRALEVALDREWRQACCRGGTVGLLLLDADCFKAYNDRYGHQEGDAVLRSIAACIRAALHQPADLGARYGGEEFVALLPDADGAGLRAAAERIRGALAERAIPHAGSPFGVVTVSVGAALARPRFGQQADLLVREADEALYEAKRGGRDRIGVAGRDPCREPAPDGRRQVLANGCGEAD